MPEKKTQLTAIEELVQSHQFGTTPAELTLGTEQEIRVFSENLENVTSPHRDKDRKAMDESLVRGRTLRLD